MLLIVFSPSSIKPPFLYWKKIQNWSPTQKVKIKHLVYIILLSVLLLIIIQLNNVGPMNGSKENDVEIDPVVTLLLSVTRKIIINFSSVYKG